MDANGFVPDEEINVWVDGLVGARFDGTDVGVLAVIEEIRRRRTRAERKGWNRCGKSMYMFVGLDWITGWRQLSFELCTFYYIVE